MDPSLYNAWRFASLTLLPEWALVGLAGLLALALWWSFRGLKSEPKRARRLVLFSLRTLVALGIFALLLEPGLELRAETRVRARVALLFDTSKSMRLPATSGSPTSRIAELQRWLKSQLPAIQELATRFQVDVYGFDKELAPQDPQRLATLPDASALAQGPTTDIVSALQQAAQGGTGGRPLAGMLVVSDGTDHGDLEQGLSSSARKDLEKLPAPVFALPIGGEVQKDLAIDKLRVDDFAFVRSQVSVDVTLKARAMPSLDVPVVLRREGQVVAQKTVHLDGDGTAEVKLQFVPDRTGKFAFTVSVPVYEGEAVAENNQKSFALKIIRDRVRALLVVGRPSWDVRFLRQLLKKDPNVDLISFFILRTPGDDAHSTQDELSLIPFPTQEIFQEQLRTFDLVIFQNFNHRPYHMQMYLDGIASYVREGGAFAMIGGDQSFAAGDFADTPIESILPVQLPMHGVPPIDESPVSMKLTEAGRRHPITELLPGTAANEALWARLPKLPGLNVLGIPRSGARVLLSSNDDKPVLVVGEAGLGRSLALATDSSWMWSFLAAGQELGPRAYESFWHAAIRWLVRDPALTPMRLLAERQTFEPGENPVLEAQVRGNDYTPAAGAQLVVQLIPSEPGAQRQVMQGPTTGQDGSARIQLPPLAPGAYKVTATARKADGSTIAEAEEAFVVAPSSLELSDAAPRPDLLKQVAKATGGRVVSASDSIANLPWRDPERVEVGQRTTKPLWDTMSVLAVLCILVAIEWSLRRRWGYA
ncbi:MAG: hypothetical protein JST92_06065 [Deltaproteobacteria bacterium]|nr:hypothetical protein [Deltaproteobacteria bacterium]